MKKNKGVILSTYIYLLLIFFLLLLATMLVVLNNTKILSNKMKETTEENLKNENFNIELVGNKEIIMFKGTTFADPGYIAQTVSGKTLTATVSGKVNKNKNGTYVISYKVRYSGKVKEVKRTVKVIDNIINFSYTGNYQEFIVPETGWYEVELWGAGGSSASGNYGKGGYTKGIIQLAKDEKIYIYVGQVGTLGEYGASPSPNSFNGGGGSTYVEYSGRGGGGATDIRYFGDTDPISADLTCDSSLGLRSRIMVAGGGGGNGNVDWIVENGIYGDAGGLIGENGMRVEYTGQTPNQITVPGIGGGPRSGYLFGIGQNSESIYNGNGGGGGGYYGGLAGEDTINWLASGGGGGSSFISGYAGVNAIRDESTIVHSNNTLHYSGKYFIDGVMTSGNNSGNGKARITYISQYKPRRVNSNLNNVRYIKNCTTYSNKNNGNFLVEIQAIYQGINIAYGRVPTETHGYLQNNDTTAAYKNAVDGMIDNISGSAGFAYSASANDKEACMVVDLGGVYNLDEIAIWNYWLGGRTFNNHIVSVSRNNSTWITIINNTAAETSQGKRVNAY